MVSKDCRPRIPIAMTWVIVPKALQQNLVPTGRLPAGEVVAYPCLVDQGVIEIPGLNDVHGKITHVLLVIVATSN